MTAVRSFPPLARDDARVLVLGSMPGVASLAAGQYYAHSRNAFWSIMGELFGAGPDLHYPARVESLLAARVALWDVLAACRRDGSLDTSIDPASMVVNDFAGFFAAHPAITHVFFNGGTAAQIFRRHVLPGLNGFALTAVRLPSTSPAHAGRSMADKLAQWRQVALALA